jgi:hypothetical protein
VAKVRTSDVEPLLREPISYLDRTVLDLLRDGVVAVSVESTHELTGERQTLRYDSEPGGWVLTAPVRAELRDDAMTELVSTLVSLRAQRVVADADQSTAYGLHEPDVVVTIDYERPGLQDAGSEDAGPEPEQFRLLVTEHEGRHYAKREDKSLIYAVDASLFEQLLNDMLKDRVWSFDQEDVTGFSVATPAGTFGFDRRDGEWIYRAEPDLPLDGKKVEDLLLRIRDLKIVRYVEYDRSEPAAYGLDEPAMTVTVDTGNGSSALLVSTSAGLAAGPVGTIEDGSGVFVLEPNVAERCAADLAELEAAGP